MPSISLTLLSLGFFHFFLPKRMLKTENPQVIKLPVDGNNNNKKTMNQQSNCWKSCDKLVDYHFAPSAWDIFMPTKKLNNSEQGGCGDPNCSVCPFPWQIPTAQLRVDWLTSWEKLAVTSHEQAYPKSPVSVAVDQTQSLSQDFSLKAKHSAEHVVGACLLSFQEIKCIEFHLNKSLSQSLFWQLKFCLM